MTEDNNYTGNSRFARQNEVELELTEGGLHRLIDMVYWHIDRDSYKSGGKSKAQAKGLLEHLEANLPNEMAAIAFCGLPGAGKSLASEVASRAFDIPAVSMGDAIRRNAPSSVRGSSEKLGEYAAEVRGEDPTTIPEWTYEEAQTYDDSLIVVEGVRSTTDYEVLADRFEEFYLIEIQAPFYTRLERLNQRGREGEDEFDAHDLVDRDDNEVENLGFGDLKASEYIDLTLNNSGTKTGFKQRLGMAFYNNLPYTVMNPGEVGIPDY